MNIEEIKKRCENFKNEYLPLFNNNGEMHEWNAMYQDNLYLLSIIERQSVESKEMKVHATHHEFAGNAKADVWTISEDPEETGWETDSGCDGYGLSREKAEYYAKCINEYPRLISIIEQYQSVAEVSRNKAQILASYCAHAIDSGRTVHGEYAFDKSQELYELLRDTLQVIRGN